jgi:hypothetical protein
MKTHTPKWTPILGVRVLVDSRIFKERLQRSKHFALRTFYIIGKLWKCRCLKWARMTHLTFATQVMAKRKVGSQTGSLTPDHKKLGIDSIPVCAGGVWHTIGKLLTRATTFLETSSWSEVWTRNYSPTKLWESKPWQFRNSPLGVSGQKNHLDVGLTKKRIEYYMGEGGGFPWVRAMMNLVSLRSPMACPNTEGAPKVY